MIPIKLIMENFISHMRSEIDFTQFNMALIIGASEGNVKIANGVGKTSIFDAIRFALYGKVRFSKKEKVIRYGRANCKVEFIFSLDGDVYKIERSMSRKTGLIDVAFYKRENDEWKQEGFTCDTPTATTLKIESLIGMSHDTFVNCIYFRQNDISGFAGAKPTKRKEILKEVLQIGFWDELQEVAKKYEKNLTDQRTIILDRLELLDDLETQYEDIESKLTSTKTELQNAKNRISELESSVKKNDEKVSKLEIILSKRENGPKKQDLKNKLKEISEKANEVKTKRDTIKREVQKNNEEISNAYNDCKFLDLQLLELAKNVLAVEHSGRGKAETIFRRLCNDAIPAVIFTNNDLVVKKRERDKSHRDLDFSKGQLNQLISLEPGKECPICLSKIDNPDDVMKRREIKQKFLQNQVIELEQKVAETEATIQREEGTFSKANEAVVEIERIELVIAKRMALVSSASEKNDTLREKFNALASEWKQLKEEKEKIISFINALADVDSCQDELNSALKRRDKLSLELNALREKVVNSSVQLGHLEANLEEIERKISEKQTLLTQKNQLTTEIDVYSEVSKAFGKDGIQAIIMENLCPVWIS